MSTEDLFYELQRRAQHDAAIIIAQSERPEKKPYLDQSRPLTGSFFDYATESTEPRYGCKTIDSISYDQLPKSDRLAILEKERDALLRQDGVDINQFRKDCEVIDND